MMWINMVVTIRRLIQLIAPFKDTEFSVEDLASRGGISPNTAKRYVRELLQRGLVKEVGYNKFMVSEKAKMHIEGLEAARRVVEDKMAYLFTDEKNMPIPLKIDSIEKLYIAIKYNFVSARDLMRHIEKGYLLKWVSETLKADMLAQKMMECKTVDDVLKILEEYLKVA